MPVFLVRQRTVGGVAEIQALRLRHFQGRLLRAKSQGPNCGVKTAPVSLPALFPRAARGGPLPLQLQTQTGLQYVT